jgi:hypothetical protein
LGVQLATEGSATPEVEYATPGPWSCVRRSARRQNSLPSCMA